MKNFFSVLLAIAILISCKTTPDSNRDYADKSKIYKLQLSPLPGSKYHYDITNQSEIKIELDGKKTNNLTKSDVGVYYDINKDSAGNLLLAMSYDKIHLYSKNRDNETDIDAANADATLNPLEKMLGALKEANIKATLSPQGEVSNMQGYKEIGDKIISEFAVNDINAKDVMKTQWEKIVANGIVKSNVDELFKIFPDSAVHVGDSWKLSSKHGDEIGLNVKNIFTLKTINNDIAIIQSEGIISADSSSNNALGFGNVAADLKGKQQAEYEMETKTGMLISCKMKADVEGTMQAMGREIPMIIKTSLKITGRKVK
ncbi:MAG TPA: DUF6263 family protein [Chitinophagaceae bacterium]|jgi:hypothetical protein|nr:DUF6263 family protein [Chitinophagaceae bacterium]